MNAKKRRKSGSSRMGKDDMPDCKHRHAKAGRNMYHKKPTGATRSERERNTLRPRTEHVAATLGTRTE